MSTTFFTRRFQPNLVSDVGDLFVFDTSLGEKHSVSVTWTQEPIEDGTNITDNRVVAQRRLPIQVMVSSAQLGGIFRDRDVQAWARLVKVTLAETPILWTVTTGLEVLENVVIESASATRTAATGNALIADLVLVQLQFSATDVAQNLADAAVDLGLGEVDLGSQGLGNTNSNRLDLSGFESIDLPPGL
jgi:hypothetical protein